MKRLHLVFLTLALLVAALFGPISCKHENAPTPAGNFPDPQDRFKDFKDSCSGVPGKIPDSYLDEYIGKNLTPDQKKQLVDGLCTWYLWVGGDALQANPPDNAGGNPQFWRRAEKLTAHLEQMTEIPVTVTLLKFINDHPRPTRLRDLGLINDPGCSAATGPDTYGLNLDKCEDPHSSGIMGLRLFANSKFDRNHWDAAGYFKNPEAYEPPYLVGLSCGVCHISFNPQHPPKDPENPQWADLAGAIGNQYLLEGKMFQGALPKNNFLYWVYELQQAGTSDTSRLSTDWIDNPNAINSVYYIDSARPKVEETLDDGTKALVPHILKDGADSIGAAGAALRVYVNIGTCAAYRMSLEDTLAGIARPQSPFDINWALLHCDDYKKTAEKMPNAAAFLDSQHGFPLARAGNVYAGSATQTAGSYGAKVSNPPQTGATSHVDQTQIPLGRQVFAENCARCHSSKIPPGLDAKSKHDPANKSKWVALVNDPTFLDGNFLSDDARYPVISSDPRFNLGTNIKRAVGTNASQGHLWQHFSSRTFKELPSPGTVKNLYNPIDPSDPLSFTIKTGGYYRTPSLISVWATAPYLHNNSVGSVPKLADGTPDPSIDGRLSAYADAMDKLLNPDKRLKWIKRTPQVTEMKIKGIGVRIPEGTPIDLLANIDIRSTIENPQTAAADLKGLLSNPLKLAETLVGLKSGKATAQVKNLGKLLLKYNTAPDFVEDHGHEFGKQLSAAEKKALIEYVKTF